jgi:flagellar FliL protein
MSDKDGDDAAGNGASDEGEDGGGKKFSSKKILLFAGLPALLLIGGVTGAYFAGVLDPLLGGDEAVHEDAPLASGNVAFYDLPEMLVNMNTGGGNQATYLKIKVSLEIEDPTMTPKLESLMPRIVDNFQVYLREVRLDDLNGSAGLYRLKEELLVRVNTAVQPLQIKDVLFREMLVQ